MVLSEAYPHHHIPEYPPNCIPSLLTEDPLSLITCPAPTITRLRKRTHCPGFSKWNRTPPQLGAQPVPHRRIRAGHPLRANDKITNSSLVKAGFAVTIVPGFIPSSPPPPRATHRGAARQALPQNLYRRTPRVRRQPAIAMVREALHHAVQVGIWRKDRNRIGKISYRSAGRLDYAKGRGRPTNDPDLFNILLNRRLYIRYKTHNGATPRRAHPHRSQPNC